MLRGAASLRSSPSSRFLSPFTRARFGIVAIIALVLAASSLVACGAAVPPAIREEIARAPRGTVTIVFFTDFQCPFCRRTHAALEPLVAAREGRVRVVLRHIPLRIHPDARSAARAAVCAEVLGADPGMTRALFTAPDLGDEACETMAVEHGVDRDRYRACLQDPATDARLTRDSAIMDSVGGDGVPVLYVGKKRLEGSQSRSALEAAIEEAEADVGALR